jgi:hypothetical protein
MARTKIKISENDLKTIYGHDYRFFQDKILPNCFCGKCCVGGGKPMVAIKNYEISLNNLNDIELQGFCADCGGPVGRYLETGEVKKYANGIKKVIDQNEK